MAALDTLNRRLSPEPIRLVAAAGLALTLGYAVFLAGSFAQGFWLLDSQGRPIASDFVNIVAAGRLALAGHAATAYDGAAQLASEIAAVGHAFDGYYPWPYPPPLLFPAAALALLPFVPALLVWLVATGAAYAASVRGILQDRAGLWLALGFPAALWNLTAGQNGFLSAALVGGALTLLPRRPLIAGACVGALAFKPHLALLFPLAFAFAGQWRALTAAAVVALALAAASWLAFGTDTWIAFVRAVPDAEAIAFAHGGAGFAKMQSAFGLVRMLGGSECLAWIIQGAVAASVAAALCLLWRGKAAFDLKAAGLGAGVLLVTPYLFIYDLTVLAIPIAFLVRYGLAHGFRSADLAGIGAAVALLLGYIVIVGPVGLAATLIVGALVIWHATGRRELLNAVPAP